MSEFSTTGTVTLEDDDDPFEWVGESDDEQFPQSRETVREHYEAKPFVSSIGETNSGLVLEVATPDGHSSFGEMLRGRGWTVDLIDWSDGLIHISPLPEEVLPA